MWAMQWVPVVLQAATVGGFTPIDLVITSGSLVGPAFYLTVVPLVVATAAMVWRRSHMPTPQWLVEGPVPIGPRSARDPSLTSALLAGAVPGLLAAATVYGHRLIVGRPGTDDEIVNRYALWLLIGALAALMVSFVTIVTVPRSGAAVGLVTGSVAAVAAGLGTVAANTFLIGNIFELSFWWMTIVSMATLWLAGYIFLLPLTLVVWPAPWRNLSGLVLSGATSVLGVISAACVIGLVLTLR